MLVEREIEIVEAVLPAMAGEVARGDWIQVQEEPCLSVLLCAPLTDVDEAVVDKEHVEIGVYCRLAASD